MAPLTEAVIPSSPSSVLSFFTVSTPLGLADSIVTDTGTTDDGVFDSPVAYCKAELAPWSITELSRYFFEETLPHHALSILMSVFGASGSTRIDRPHITQAGTLTPPANQLALLNTLLVHPSCTTRIGEQFSIEVDEIASNALAFLRSLLATVGPINCHFKQAFRFERGRKSGHSTLKTRDSSEEPEEEKQLTGKYATNGVWQCGCDFFGIVGWAFNCSVVYPHRWKHWKVWLEFMLDLLEADLHERRRVDLSTHMEQGGVEDDCQYQLLGRSILAGYIGQQICRGRSGGVKWIMRAIFADGDRSSNSLFQEVWPKEHRGTRKIPIDKRKFCVNLDGHDFGNMLDDESNPSSQASEPPTPQKKKSQYGKPEFQALIPSYAESVALRQRVFVLLSYLCHYLPEPPFDMARLYEEYRGFLAPQPLPIFTAFIASTTSELLKESQISILRPMLERMMPSKTLSPLKVDRERCLADGISPAMLELCFLPNVANTSNVEDNAKVSLLLEELVLLVWLDGTEPFSEAFRASVKKGTAARSAKAAACPMPRRGKNRVRSGPSDEDAEAMAVLEGSEKRLIALVDLIETERQDGDGDSDMDEAATDPRPTDVAMQHDEADDSMDATFMTAPCP